MNLESIDIQALAREIAAQLDPNALMNGDDLAAYFRCCRRQAVERIAKRKGFPTPVQRGLWRRREVIEFANTPAKRGPGRPRRQLSSEFSSE